MYLKLEASPLEAYRGLNSRVGVDLPLLILVFKRKSNKKIGEGGDFFFWKRGGTLPLNSYKPSQDLPGDTL